MLSQSRRIVFVSQRRLSHPTCLTPSHVLASYSQEPRQESHSALTSATARTLRLPLHWLLHVALAERGEALPISAVVFGSINSDPVIKGKEIHFFASSARFTCAHYRCLC